MDDKRRTQDYIRELISILFIQKKVIVGITIIFVIGSILFAFLWPPVYSSSGSILIKSKKILKSPAEIEKITPRITPITQTDLYSEMGIFTSEELIKRTLMKKEVRKLLNFDSSDPIQLNKMINKVRKNLKTELVPKSTIFNVTLYWDDPYIAKKLLEELMHEYLILRSEIHSPKEAIPFFENQLKKFNQELIANENKLIKISKKNNAAAPVQQISSNLLIIKNLDMNINSLKNKIIMKENEINYIKKLLKQKDINFFSFIKNPDIADMSKKLQDLIAEKEKILRFYTENSPKAKSMDHQIKQMYDVLKQEVRKYIQNESIKLRAMKKSLKDMQRRVNELMLENVKLYEAQIRSRQIERELKVLENAFTVYSQRLQEAKIKSSTQAGEIFTVSILSNPTLNLQPVFPQKAKVIPIGSFIGLILGITIGYLIEFFDHTFKRPEDVKNYTGLKTIFSIPEWE